MHVHNLLPARRQETQAAGSQAVSVQQSRQLHKHAGELPSLRPDSADAGRPARQEWLPQRAVECWLRKGGTGAFPRMA